ncbi:MAG: spermidine/putrescine ABC transporter ATP-binding protein [Rhodobacteraceae bacterium PARR1]|nr:MAG: spermidine/putrescine ABC transporter ATP-binding protein [Rhodobacteraceae bacterium PARR1]
MQSPAVRVIGLTRRFDSTLALNDVSLDVAEGRFVSLLGPSGCGKTTLMRIIAGLDRQTSGRVEIAGVDHSASAPNRRPVGLVFQRYALFPHLTVAQNVGFSMQIRGEPQAAIARRVTELLRLIQLDDYGPRSIDQLSGGQAQRVALARILASDPPVLLLDEPMSALDLKLRQSMQIELRQLQRQLGKTFIFVTHDQHEAMVMSDEIVLMNAGRIVQRGSPEEVYFSPNSLFSARFLGDANLIPGTFQNGVLAGDGVICRPAAAAAMTRAEGWACIRPESVTISLASGEHGPNMVHARISETIFQGASRRYHALAGSHRFLVDQPTTQGTPLGVGDEVRLSWPDSAVAMIDEPTHG